MRKSPIRIAKDFRSTSVRSAALPAILSAALVTALMAVLVMGAAAPAVAQPGDPVQTVNVSPYQVESGKPFQAILSGKTTLCDPQFSRHEAKVEDGVVNFTVMAVNNPLAKCSGDSGDFKTEFAVPALKAGEYRVEARLYPACHYDKPPCQMLRDPVEFGGTLYVTDSAKLTVAMRPDKVSADKPFDLFITSKNFTCGNEYTNLSSSVQGRVLYVAFTNRPRPEVLCPAILTDYGPTFKIPALKPGVYQVMAVISPYCGTEGPCPLALIAPQLAGALTVGEDPLSLRADGNDSREGYQEGSRETGGSGIGNAARGTGMRHGELRIDPRQGAVIRWYQGTSTVTGKRR